MTAPSPVVELTRGSAAAFHGRAVPDDPVFSVWGFDVAATAIALGSRQGVDTVDVVACRRQGIDVVRRRSGGGAVLLVPGDIVWIDVIVPARHPLWVDDVRASMVRIGEAWAAALAGIDGVPAELRVHRDGVERTPWSELVCFAGAGPGEVFEGDRKLVGISQRRTRGAARFQCAVHRRYDAERTVSLLAGPLPDGPIPDSVGVVPAALSTEHVVDRLVAALVD